MFEVALPNMHALAVMIMIVIALILFARDNIPLETTSLVVLVCTGHRLPGFSFRGLMEKFYLPVIFFWASAIGR